MQKKQKKYKISSVVAIVCFLIAIPLFAILIPRIAGGGSGSSKRNFVDIPTISVNAPSADGQSHKVTVDITLEYGDDMKWYVNTADLTEKISEIIKEMDYDEIAGANGPETLRSTVLESLNGFADADDLEGVYITDLICGDIQIYSEEKSASNQNEAMKGLFKKIR